MSQEKPTAIPVQFDNIPLDLKMIPRWCMWKFMQVGEGEQQKWSKIPMQANGHRGSSTNQDTWTDFLTAQNTYEKGGYDGVGFVFTGDDDLVGIDIDDCIDLDTTEINEFAQDILSRVQGYAEISPSGTGLKIFTRADLQKAHVDHDKGLEIYPKSRYFTITGHKLGGDIPEAAQDVTALVPARTLDRDEDAFSNYSPPVEGWDLARVEAELLSELDPDCHYDLWREIGMALHHQFQGDVEALNLWDTWSEGSPKYTSNGTHSCHTKWATFRGNGITLRSLIFRVNQQKLRSGHPDERMQLDLVAAANEYRGRPLVIDDNGGFGEFGLQFAIPHDDIQPGKLEIPLVPVSGNAGNGRPFPRHGNRRGFPGSGDFVLPGGGVFGHSGGICKRVWRFSCRCQFEHISFVSASRFRNCTWPSGRVRRSWASKIA